jgi:hypothetical protein
LATAHDDYQTIEPGPPYPSAHFSRDTTLGVLVLSYPLQSYKLSTKNQTSEITKEAFTVLIVVPQPHFYRSNESQYTRRRWIKHALKGFSNFMPTNAPSGPALTFPNHPPPHGPLVLSYPLKVL